MIRFWRSVIGIGVGAAVGAFAMNYVSTIFGYGIAVVNWIVFGIPMLFGFIGGVMENTWYEFWPVIVWPIVALVWVALALVILAVMALIQSSIWHLLWILALIGLFIPPTIYVVVVIAKKG